MPGLETLKVGNHWLTAIKIKTISPTIWFIALIVYNRLYLGLLGVLGLWLRLRWVSKKGKDLISAVQPITIHCGRDQRKNFEIDTSQKESKQFSTRSKTSTKFTETFLPTTAGAACHGIAIHSHPHPHPSSRDIGNDFVRSQFRFLRVGSRISVLRL